MNSPMTERQWLYLRELALALSIRVIEVPHSSAHAWEIILGLEERLERSAPSRSSS